MDIYTCMNYYNEHDPYAAEWLRNLIRSGQIPDGFVDERDILDVVPNELLGYCQCHFFAGIGGWSYALKIAGWPSDKQIWTGSCPCQPFSAAGKGKGFADQRHLWPAFFHLIQQCAPSIIVGEQVASANVDSWIDLVQLDLEGLGYAFGSVPFPASGIGAPHMRDRNYWGSIRLDNTDYPRLEGHAGNGGATGWQGQSRPASPPGVSMRLAYTNQYGLSSPSVTEFHNEEHHVESRSDVLGMAHAEHDGHHRSQGLASVTHSDQSQQRILNGDCPPGGELPGPTNGHWRLADWLNCRDGKWRPVEPGTFPLANGIPNRVGQLRGYGNAIVPQQAIEFIRALL